MTHVRTTVQRGVGFCDERETNRRMATETRQVGGSHSAMTRIQYGVAGGIVAGVGMGVLLQFVLGVMPAIGALSTLGEPSLTAGWAAHIVHSVLFGALFAVVGAHRLLTGYLGNLGSGAAGGALYATTLWAVNVVVVWPVWLSATAVGSTPSAPYLNPMPLVGHLIYGVVLGLVVAAVAGSTATPAE